MAVRFDLKCSAAMAAVGLVAACDSTVGLDSQRKYFDKFLVSGMCQATESFDRADVALQILSTPTEGGNGLVPVLPDDRIAGEQQTVQEVLSTRDFKFALPQDHEGVDASQFQGFFENSARQGGREGASLLGQDLRFDWTGGDDRREDDRLVVFLVDHSGSLIGQPDPGQPPQATKASDINDEHITFLRTLLNYPTIPKSTYFSLVWFDGRQPNISREFATPTRNHDVIACPTGTAGADCRLDEGSDGLGRVGYGETGATPLIAALDKTYEIVIDGDNTRNLNPVVVLFTDGVEDGDSSQGGKSMNDVIDRYSQHTYDGTRHPVPVIVLHLAASLASGNPRDRDPDLYALACATGGEYIYLERPSDFLDKDLAPLISSRLFGTWRLTTSSGELEGADAGQYLLSTAVTVTLGDKSKTAALEKPKDPGAKDARLWFVKF